jgi:uncharacterized membrane protein YgdD (TMEM256/DUF423 family)
MHKGFLRTGAILGGIAVALGAFGAHGLKQIVPPETVTTFQTGVQYQMYHSLALLIVAIIFDRFPNKLIKLAGNFFIYGIVFFSGSLYILTLLKATETVGLSNIGIITPIGGLFFIAAWIFLFVGISKKN